MGGCFKVFSTKNPSKGWHRGEVAQVAFGKTVPTAELEGRKKVTKAGLHRSFYGPETVGFGARLGITALLRAAIA
jgi:hypothetical protein